MKLLEGEDEYSFSSSRYEEVELGPLDYEVEVLDDSQDIFEAFQGTGSCIEVEDPDTQKAYADTFAESDNVHFYRVGDKGYARAVELPTTQGEAMAVDAVKTGNDFDTEVYRAAVNSVFRHAELLDKDLLLGGKEFFRHRWHQTLDLTHNESKLTPAEEVFFDEAVADSEISVGYKEKGFRKGEQWRDMEEYFVSWL